MQYKCAQYLLLHHFLDTAQIIMARTRILWPWHVIFLVGFFYNPFSMWSSKQHKCLCHHHESYQCPWRGFCQGKFGCKIWLKNLAANNSRHHDEVVAAVECDDGDIANLGGECAPSASSPGGMSEWWFFVSKASLWVPHMSVIGTILVITTRVLQSWQTLVIVLMSQGACVVVWSWGTVIVVLQL